MQTKVKHSETVAKDEVKAGTGTVRQVLIGADEAPHFAMRRFIMQPGGGMPKHTNTVEHEQYVLQGQADIGVGSDVYKVKQGDVLFIPANMPHWYKVTSSEPFEFLCMVPNLPDEINILG